MAILQQKMTLNSRASATEAYLPRRRALPKCLINFQTRDPLTSQNHSLAVAQFLVARRSNSLTGNLPFCSSKFQERQNGIFFRFGRARFNMHNPLMPRM
jgi:hypothetical protein